MGSGVVTKIRKKEDTYDDKMAKLNGTPWKKPVWATQI